MTLSCRALPRRTLLLAAAAAPLAASLPRVATAAPAAGNALWIWGTGKRDWPQVARIMRREGFATAYLSIPPDDRKALGVSAAALDSALAPFADQGLAVMLAGGDPNWADGRPLTPPPLEALLRMAGSARQVAGVQLDIEPYILPLWRSGEEGRARIAASLMDRLGEARKAMRESGKLLGMVLHPAFANAALPPGQEAGTLADGVVERCDRLVVMAYRNRPDAVETFAAKLLTALDANPKPWQFGITVQGGPEQDLISYAASPWERVRADMADLDARGKRRGSGGHYGGVAVHAYASLLPKLAG